MGDTASTDHGGLDRRLECRDVDPGVPAGRHTTALAAGVAGQGWLPIAGLAHHQPHRAREYTECYQWRAEIIARLQAEHPKLIVLSRRYGGRLPTVTYDPAWIDSMTRLCSSCAASAQRCWCSGRSRIRNQCVPNCLSLHLDDATACSPLRSVAVNDPGIAAETAAVKAGGGQYADLTELFCTAERCPVIVGNTLVYFDRHM